MLQLSPCKSKQCRFSTFLRLTRCICINLPQAMSVLSYLPYEFRSFLIIQHAWMLWYWSCRREKRLFISISSLANALCFSSLCCAKTVQQFSTTTCHFVPCVVITVVDNVLFQHHSFYNVFKNFLTKTRLYLIVPAQNLAAHASVLVKFSCRGSVKPILWALITLSHISSARHSE